MIELITFTGVDARTPMDELEEINRDYPRTEFAVLVGSQTGRDNPEYPPMNVVQALLEARVNNAVHLCGTHARQAAGMEPGTNQALRICEGFGRVQVNLMGQGGDTPERNRAIRDFAERVAARTVILQHQGPWETVPILHPRIEYLQDPSGGRGKQAFREWPDPPPGRRAGYSGGLGPSNIRQALDFAERFPQGRIWLDMQRHVRDPRGWLDLRRIREVCRQAFGKERI